jgi:hypothetical protein
VLGVHDGCIVRANEKAVRCLEDEIIQSNGASGGVTHA